MMRPFLRHEGLVVPFESENVNTDAILPKQFMKSIERTGYGEHLFDGLRYLDHGQPGMDCTRRPLNPDFVLNQPRYRGATVLLGRRNFGCGSSREHAPWALEQFGFRLLIAPSFADIFRNNCLRNGMLTLELDEAVVDRLFTAVVATPGYRLTVDLQSQRLVMPAGETIAFEVEAARRERLLQGLDEISATLMRRSEIERFEAQRRRLRPWLFQASLQTTGAPASAGFRNDRRSS